MSTHVEMIDRFIERHGLKMNGVKNLKETCKLCQSSASDKWAKIAHVIRDHLKKERHLKCSICRVRGYNYGNMRDIHVAMCHPDSDAKILDSSNEYEDEVNKMMTLCFTKK